MTESVLRQTDSKSLKNANKGTLLKRVGIVGATGYTGLELCRLLCGHSKVIITHVYSNQHNGKVLSDIYPQLSQHCDLVLEPFDPKNVAQDIDVLFLAVPHGVTHSYMPELSKATKAKIIDLSADFRLSNVSLFEAYYHNHNSPELLNKIPYGLPELFRSEIKNARIVANPGCYPTTVILALFPLIKAGVVSAPFISDSKSGVTGAGKTLKEGSLYCEVNNGFSAYGTGIHRHESEMKDILGVDVFFSPHLLPMNRGILSTIYASTSATTTTDIQNVFETAYLNEPFVKLAKSNEMPSTKYVMGTNDCRIGFRLFPEKKQLVLFSAIDNIVKGASGQAVQCMNIMCDFKESEGLTQVGMYI